MTNRETLEKMNKIFINIFGRENPYTLEEILSKFAFDIKLPQKVLDSMTNKETWAESINPNKFITQKNMELFDIQHGWLQKKKDIDSLEDVLKYWKKINYTTTERIYDSENVHKSDTIYRSENVYRSLDCRECKNTIYCDGCANSEFIMGCQRTSGSNFCIRVDDSGECINSYNVICSSKISNSFFIQDCKDLDECMFCSHISNKKYCISNMQCEKEEYFTIKKEIINWILQKN
ncbi:MAG TPA: hypothetical protein IAD08_04990 [Candidatus Scatovivens faecipullorum]|nr:hypothetical protein [Candidatus Scatovivens faecipullorum]